MKNQLALKRAIFPNQNTLQPIPNDNGQHPNISGNINSTTNSFQSTQNPSSELTYEQSEQNTQQANQANTTHGFAFYLTWFLIIVLIISFGVFVYKKLSRS